MNKTILILFFVIFGIISACGLSSLTGSGTVISREEDLTDFNKIEVSQGFQVDVQNGETYKVIIRADDNIMDYVTVDQTGDRLMISLAPNRPVGLIDVTLEAEITLPELRELDLSGGSHGNLINFEAEKVLDLYLMGGSHLNGDLEAGHVHFYLDGGSHVTLSGSVEENSVLAEGGSHAKLGNFAAADCEVEAKGGSQITVNCSDRLDAVANGGSHIKFRGNPTQVIKDSDNSSSIGEQ